MEKFLRKGRRREIGEGVGEVVSEKHAELGDGAEDAKFGENRILKRTIERSDAMPPKFCTH
jgi:hypothetical protein